MKILKNPLFWYVVGAILLIIFVVRFAMNKSGETLQTMTGEIYGCTQLGGNKTDSLSHATIKTEENTFVATSIESCSPGKKVVVYIQRGILYFNTVYVAEEQ